MNYKSDDAQATGVVTTLWGNLYIHIDYNYNGVQLSEKMLLIENLEDNTAKLFVVSGPHPADIAAQEAIWNHWLQEVKELSEMQ